MRAWSLLLVAGLFEVIWAVGLKYTDGLTRPGPTVLTLVSMIASMLLLASAVKELPIGTAYAVWVGIGVVGTFFAGLLMLGESFSWARMGFAAMLIVALVGLKVTTPA